MNIRSLLGAFQTQPDQFQNLLGEYYDPKTAKMKWLGGTLQGLGMGLASGQPGAWASGLTQGGGQAIDDYRQQALLGMKVKQANEDRTYGREQDQRNWDYRVNRDKVSDSQWARDQALKEKQLADQAAWNSLVKAQTMKGWQEENALKQGQSNAVNAWTGQFKSQGGDLFSPEMQAGLRAQGIQGVDPADTVKYRTAQQLMQAGAVGPAFDVVATPNPMPKAPQIVELYDEKTGQPYKARWDDRTGAFVRLGGVKAASNGISIGPDGTVQIGGGKPLTEGQSKDTVYSTRAEGALPYIDSNEKILTNGAEVGKGKVPIIGNYLTSEEYQVADSAGKEFLQALLRKDTGATIQPFELQEYGSVYLPQPGDKPKVLEYKREARKRALAAIKAGMPPQAIVAQEKALAGGGQVSEPIGKGDRPPPRGSIAPPPAAINALRANPNLADQFDQKYGPGSAAAVLSGQ